MIRVRSEVLVSISNLTKRDLLRIYSLCSEEISFRTYFIKSKYETINYLPKYILEIDKKYYTFRDFETNSFVIEDIIDWANENHESLEQVALDIPDVDEDDVREELKLLLDDFNNLYKLVSKHPKFLDSDTVMAITEAKAWLDSIKTK